MTQPTEPEQHAAGSDSYPRQYARTRRFTCGEPRNVQITPLGIVFLRSQGGSDPSNGLWRAPINSQGALGDEQLLFDPSRIDERGEVSVAERARRERMREQADGLTGYSLSADGRFATFSLAGEIVLADISSPSGPAVHRVLNTPPGSFDPQISADADFVAYLSDGQLHVQHVAGADAVLAHDDNPDITWGLADFNAAEEFNRFRGYWWSPDSRHLAVARVDNTPVQTWWIADPAHPDQQPTPHRYPVAGTANALVTLWLIATDGSMVEAQLRSAHADMEYLLAVTWTDRGLVATTLDRSQTHQCVMRVEADGSCSVLHTVHDPQWVELVSGTPALCDVGIVHTADSLDAGDSGEGTRSLMLVSSDGTSSRISEPNFLVEHVSHVADSASVICTVVDTDHGSMHRCVIRSGPDGFIVLAGGAEDPGVHSVSAATDTTVVIRSASLDRQRAEHIVMHGSQRIGTLSNLAEVPAVNPRPAFLKAGIRHLPVAVLLPSDPALREPGVRLPVLMDPYAGPHAPRVMATRAAMASSQWLADQGFAVVIVDGRGTPGIGPAFERAVHLDFAGPVLADQVIGLLEAGANFAQLDLTRVGIRGWSFGGFTAALAVLKRPDVFHCAVVGAPVIDWRLYDTGYTERYLGNPALDDAPYEASSLLHLASTLTRPIQLIHGLADDNVVAANTLRFSSALVAAGIPHEVLPLSGVTHMTPQEEVAENMLLLQVDFLRRHLGGPTRV